MRTTLIKRRFCISDHLKSQGCPSDVATALNEDDSSRKWWCFVGWANLWGAYICTSIYFECLLSTFTLEVKQICFPLQSCFLFPYCSLRTIWKAQWTSISCIKPAFMSDCKATRRKQRTEYLRGKIHEVFCRSGRQFLSTKTNWWGLLPFLHNYLAVDQAVSVYSWTYRRVTKKQAMVLSFICSRIHEAISFHKLAPWTGKR